MEVMLAYDHSRNARIALEAVKKMFLMARELPRVTLVTVIEEPGSNANSGDELFSAQYQEQKAGTEAAAAELALAGGGGVFRPGCWWPRATRARCCCKPPSSTGPTCW